ncbi:hypothetical protein BKA69DRAFT_755596 [Paraphysoderma sedebokerense]|nr:hypothetical protein BKA69DRAFT_755596 [Paraphysoderma sedebokerense]
MDTNISLQDAAESSLSLSDESLASDFSIDTAAPDHTVKFTVSIHYFLQKDLNSVKKQGAKSIRKNQNPSEVPRFYITYKIADKVVNKTNILHATNSHFTASHDIDISLEFLADLYQDPIEFKIFKVVKAVSENGQDSNSEQPAPSQQTLMFRKASLDAITKRLITLSKCQNVSPRTRRKLEAYRAFVLNNYKSLPPTVRVKASTEPPISRNIFKDSSASRRNSTVQNSTENISNSSYGIASTFNPKSNSRIGSATSTNNSINQKRRHSTSATDISEFCTFIRPKTPPQPHHSEEPGKTIKLVPDLPKRKVKVAEDEHLHVGSIFVDPSLLFLGELHVSSSLDESIDGLVEVEVGITLNDHLLSISQEESLNPLTITILQAENLPSQPISYSDLSKLCQPVFTRFSFLDQPNTRHKSRKPQPHARTCRFDSRHVVLTGLHDAKRLKELFLYGNLEVEVHDRDKILIGGKDKLTVGSLKSQDIHGTSPYGVARFRLPELVSGVKSLSLKAPIVPARTDPSYELQNEISPGFYLESDSLLKIKVESKYPIFGMTDEVTGNFLRMVISSKPSDSRIFKDILTRIEALNIFGLELNTQDSDIAKRTLGEYKLSPEQRKDKHLDIITGNLISDDNFACLFIEGRADGAMKSLGIDLASLNLHQYSHLNVYYDPQITFQERIWQGVSPNIHWVHLKKPVEEVMKDSKTYIRNKLPSGAFDALRILSEIYNRDAATVFKKFSHLFLLQHQVGALACAYAHFKTDSTVDNKNLERYLSEVQTNDSVDNKSDDNKKCRKKGDDSKVISAKVETKNTSFEKFLKDRKSLNIDFVKEYASQYPSTSTPLPRSPVLSEPIYIYSTQHLNTTERERKTLFERLSKDKLYCYEHSPSQTVVLVDAKEYERNKENESKKLWIDKKGFRVLEGEKLSISNLNAPSTRITRPYIPPNVYEVIPLRLPEKRDSNGKILFNAFPSQRKQIYEKSDLRVIFFAADVKHDLEKKENEHKLTQRITWDGQFGVTRKT